VDPPSEKAGGGSTTGASPSPWPSIKGPPSATRSAQPPSFTVNAGPGRFFVVEVATASVLFDTTHHANERSSNNFYGSWSDTPLIQGNNYMLPSSIWQRLGNADRLYYRIGSTPNSKYDDYQVSSKDDAGEAIPTIVING
jgi:hypothetical protein